MGGGTAPHLFAHSLLTPIPQDTLLGSFCKLKFQWQKQRILSTSLAQLFLQRWMPVSTFFHAPPDIRVGNSAQCGSENRVPPANLPSHQPCFPSSGNRSMDTPNFPNSTHTPEPQGFPLIRSHWRTSLLHPHPAPPISRAYFLFILGCSPDSLLLTSSCFSIPGIYFHTTAQAKFQTNSVCLFTWQHGHT